MDANQMNSALGQLNASLAQVSNSIGAANLDKYNKQFAREEAEKQRQWNEEMWTKTNAWNYQMWQETNAYNSPEAQVQRLRDAGLNPMYYGLDGSSADAFQASQPLGYERADYQSTINPIAQGIDAALKVAQISNVQANTAKQSQETISEVQRREKVQAEIDQIKQENQNLIHSGRLTQAQAEQVEKNNAWLDRINEATVAEKEANAALDKATKTRIEELLEGEKILQAKSAQDFDEKWKKIRAEIGKIAKETGLLDKDIENYALNHASNGFMGTGLSLQNIFRGLKGLRPESGKENNFSDGGTDPMELVRAGQ